MYRTRLIAFLAALVLILSLTAPALASEEPAEELTEYSNLNAPGEAALVDGKVFCGSCVSSDDGPYPALAVLDTDFSELFTVDDSRCYMGVVCFDDALYCAVQDLEDQSWSLVRVDPDTYAAETVWQPDPDMASNVLLLSLCGVIGDKLYFDVTYSYDQGESHTVCRINSAGGVETCFSLDEAAHDAYGIYMIPPYCTQDGLWYGMKDGSFGLFTPGMQLLRQYDLPMSSGYDSIKGRHVFCFDSQEFDLIRADLDTGASVNLSKQLRDQYGYTPIFRLSIDASADSLYLAGLEEDGTLTVFRLDPDTLEAAVAGQVQVDFDCDANSVYSNLLPYLLETGDCLVGISTSAIGETGHMEQNLQWVIVPLSAN